MPLPGWNDETNPFSWFDAMADTGPSEVVGLPSSNVTDQAKPPDDPSFTKRPVKPVLFDEGVKLISYCPLCASSYNPREARVLGEKEDTHLLHIQCGNCGCAIIALVLISPVGVSSVGLVTDCSSGEAHDFSHSAAVSVDDVIDIHELLKDGQPPFHFEKV